MGLLALHDLNVISIRLIELGILGKTNAGYYVIDRSTAAARQPASCSVPLSPLSVGMCWRWRNYHWHFKHCWGVRNNVLHDRPASMLRKSASYQFCDLSPIPTARVLPRRSATGCISYQMSHSRPMTKFDIASDC